MKRLDGRYLLFIYIHSRPLWMSDLAARLKARVLEQAYRYYRRHAMLQKCYKLDTQIRQECARNVLWLRLSCTPLITAGTKRLLGAGRPDGTTRVLDRETEHTYAYS